MSVRAEAAGKRGGRKGQTRLGVVTIVKDSEYTKSDPASKDVVMVRGGRVRGSCGAPYFNLRGEVVAFYFESVDDSSVYDSEP